MSKRASKKGISTVVATLLIILLTIVAVTIVWQILKPTITKTAGRISAGCTDVELSIDKCDKTAGSEAVTLTLKSGEISKLVFNLYDSSGATIGSPIENTTVPGTTETKTYGFDTTTFSSALSVNIASYITSETGDDILCGFASKEPVACIE